MLEGWVWQRFIHIDEVAKKIRTIIKKDPSYGYLISAHLFTDTHYINNHICPPYTRIYTLMHTHRKAEDNKGISAYSEDEEGTKGNTALSAHCASEEPEQVWLQKHITIDKRYFRKQTVNQDAGL